MELSEAMRCAPTSRHFKPDPVPGEVLVRALDSARFAPSGGNRQGWRVVVVQDADRKRELRDLYLPHWRAYMEQTGGAQMLADSKRADPEQAASEQAASGQAASGQADPGQADPGQVDPGQVDPKRVRMVRRANDYAENLEQVPVHLVVGVRLGDLAVTDSHLPRQSIVGGASVYPFVQNLLLALRGEGLGAALTTLLVPAEEEVRRLLEIPEEIALAAHIGVGYRADPWPERLSRRPVEEFAFTERYGDPLSAR
jgi:nitroreductase